MERTLILLKPDAVKRGLVGEIINRFEKTGLKIIGMKMVSPDEDHYFHHYETIRGDYSHISYEHSNSRNAALPNIIHASGNKEEAEQEVAHWFSDQELFEYQTVHEHLTQNP
jgi:nucleoside-diphosphate kinase